VNDQIIELLENTELRQKVISVIKKVWNYAGTLWDNPDDDLEELEEYVDSTDTEAAFLFGKLLWRAKTCGDSDKIEEVFDEYVIQKMAKPYRLTLQELFKAFFHLAKPDERHYTDFKQFTSDDCNNLYSIFVNYVKNQILSYRRSDPFPICCITDHEVEEETVWGKNGVTLRLLRGSSLIDARPVGRQLYQVLALIEGNISTLACRYCQSEMGRILPTAIRSADLLEQTKFEGQNKVVEVTIPDVILFEINGLPFGADNLLENGKPLIRQYLDAYYSEPSKKDSMNKGIRNAVYLLIESDNQPNDAIGLALSIDAIDALLGEKGKETTLRLADNVATLLEPDLKQRSNAAQFVTHLYDARSDALHGRAVETESETRIYARHLAAATLSGAIDLMNSLRSLGDESKTRQELLQKLRERRFQAGQPLGVKEYNVRTLWRNRKTEKKDSIL